MHSSEPSHRQRDQRHRHRKIPLEDLTTLLAVYDKDDNLIYRFEYAEGRMPVSMTDKDGTRYYLHYDQVGSLRAVSDSNHNIVKEITYDTYGNILSDSNPSFKVPFGFAGGLYDPNTKLTHFGFREYDAFTGKWTSKDPILFEGGDSNLYGYVLNDPVNLVDPWGLAPESLKKKIKDIIGICKDGKIDCDELLKKGRNYCIENAGLGMYILYLYASRIKIIWQVHV